MEHHEALESRACEKYLLGELAPAEREAFEEHYFSCSECADQLRCAVEFLSSSREIFAASQATPPVADYIRPPGGWFPWMNPFVSGPVFAALLLFLAYQNLVTIPKYKEAASSRVLPMHSLITANTLGESALTFAVTPERPFGTYVDLPYDPAFSLYRLVLQSPSGQTTPLRSLNSAEAQKTQVITINPGKQAGEYTIVVYGLATPDAEPSSAKELARLQFTVAFTP
jgi:hypothetical protein